MESPRGEDSILIERGLGRGEMLADMGEEAKRAERHTKVKNDVFVVVDDDDDDDDDDNNNNDNENWKHVLFQVIVSTLHIRDKKYDDDDDDDDNNNNNRKHAH